MRNFLLFLLGFVLWSSNIGAENSQKVGMISKITEHLQIPQVSECDSIIEHNGFKIHIIKSKGEIKHIGLNLFSNEMKESVDKDLLNYIEESLLAKSLKINGESYDDLNISGGSISDFKNISPENICTVNISNSKYLSAEWIFGNKNLTVIIPIGYDTATKGSRSDIENDFLSKLKSFKGNRIELEIFNKDKLEPYGEDKLIFPGSSYQNKNITRSTFFNSSDLRPIWDSEYPLESMANLFIFPSEEYGDSEINLTILKHEYGEKETLVIPVNQLLSMCESEGCMPYWGVEKYDNGILEGALFLYNHRKGYDHVIKITCNPVDVINNHGVIEGRVSLFIPTNNVRNLHSPYVKKTEKEKIKYDE